MARGMSRKCESSFRDARSKYELELTGYLPSILKSTIFDARHLQC